jgi:hypothetical protein
VQRTHDGAAAGSGLDDEEGNSGWLELEEEKAVASAKGVRTGPHPTAGSM